MKSNNPRLRSPATGRPPGAGGDRRTKLRGARKLLSCLTATTIVASILLAPAPAAAQGCDVTANVVAMDQVITYNRMGAFSPAGMIFALARDVFPKRTLVKYQTLANSCAYASCGAGNVQLRDDKRPRPLTLRVNAGCNIQIKFTNLLNKPDITDARNEAAGIQLCEVVDGEPRPGICQSEQPMTRNVGLHINGMRWVNGAGDDGSYVGSNSSSVGTATTHTLFAEKEGAYVITSGPNLGGEGGTGAIASGLFGVLNVEPADAEWYRSQVTREEMEMATTDYTTSGHPVIDYEAVYPAGHPYAGEPILNMRKGNEIVYSDLNAVIDGPMTYDLPKTQLYPNRGEPFREFTVAFHDEVKMVQAFPGWFDALPFTLGSVKDGFAINYGTGGIGAEIIGNRLGVGPMHECVECKYEEFFLTSWAVGDPAMIVDIPANAGLESLAPGAAPPEGTQGKKATKAFYPSDPSNVWHGYLNDRTKIRNLHVGTEHHIFHLHAHQWLFASLDDTSSYVDAQALGPGSSFTYEITYGGGGNRNKTAGDSIFHCHFYPHFAQGMWGLWRVHDTFETGSTMNSDGTVAARGLPDAEICTGTCGGYAPNGTALPGGSPTPGVIPLPTKAMAPMPGAFVADTDGDTVADTRFMGYPFYIAGTIGHRPPTPPKDLVYDGGIPRHVITGGTADATQTSINFDKVLTGVSGYQVPEDGTREEKAAMAFHGPQSGSVYHRSFAQKAGMTGVDPAFFEVNGMDPVPGAPFADPCRGDYYDGGLGNLIGNPKTYKASVIEVDAELNKVGWHFGQSRIIVFDGDVAATYAGTRAPEPFVMRANTRDCIDFHHTNLVPNVYQLDDYQVKTPTDVIGQHIHLVKFDVLSSDGSANGWNYEDGTLSPDELIERHHAFTASSGSFLGTLGTPSRENPRTTRQRWYLDPGWTGNVFTHDHYGPSTHQQAGLYATLLVEPEGSKWLDPTDHMTEFGSRYDGGPTSWKADIDCSGCSGDEAGDAWREFYLEFADFQLAYRSAAGDGAGYFNGPERPVNPSDREEVETPDILQPNCIFTPGYDAGPNGCRPEAISAEDPGTFVVNYRNDPVALRVRDPLTNTQATGLAGDLSHVYRSGQVDADGNFTPLLRADGRLNLAPEYWPYNTRMKIQTANQGALTGDPFTPLMQVYEGDKVSLRVQVGAHEEGHNFSMNGIRWLQSKSGYSGFRNSQMAGISEYFIFEVPASAPVKGGLPFEDYMYQTGSSVDARWNGSWGLMRAYAEANPDLKPLPTNPNGKVPKNPEKREFSGVCPRSAPLRKYDVWAVRAADVLPTGAIEYNPSGLNDPTGLMYVLKSDIVKKTGLLKANRRVEPLILRAAAGECINVTLTNKFVAAPLDLDGFNLMPMIVNEFNGNDIVPSSEVGLHAQLVEYDMSKSDGMNVGFNPVQTVPPGGIAKYKWYAGKVDVDVSTGHRTPVPTEFGAVNLSSSDPIEGSSKGLIGALVIEPAGSTWPADGEQDENYQFSRAAVTVTSPAGTFRDFVVIIQDDVNMRFANGDPVPIVAAEEDSEDSGMKGINYRTEPIWQKLGIGPTADAAITRKVDFTDAFAGDPATPIFTAYAGEQVRFRVLKPGGHNRNHVFTLHGHLWARHPFNNGSTEIDPLNTKTFWHGEQMGHGPTGHINVVPLRGAGMAGDYFYGDQSPVHVYNGIWGIFRVQ